jgi:serine protease Do
MSDHQLTEIIERYLRGEMTADERLRFEMLSKENADINSRLEEHQQFTAILKQYGQRLELENTLNAIHQEIDVHALKEELTDHPSWVVSMWRNHHSKISVAASIAIFTILSTLFFTGYFSNKSQLSTFKALRREVDSYKRSTENLNRSTNALIHNINAGKKVISPGKYGGTGFALSSNGYIATAYHVVNNADSVYVQNSDGESFKTSLVYAEPAYDVAILKIVDPSFKNMTALPYTLKKSKSDLAEDVYTLGYPGNTIVVGKGYLASSNGFRDDTTAYQISIPVNPGDSGSPLLDSKGNVIGIISGKQTQMEGAAYAVKSAYILKTIQNIPADSLTRKLTPGQKNTLAGLSHQQQIKKLQNYVFMVKVYN